MIRPTRLLAAGCIALVALHLLGATLLPGRLWGASQLAAWPAAVGIGWTVAGALIAMLVLRFGPSIPALPYPNRRGSVLLAGVCGVLFWVLRERTHFFGDGYLLIRDRGNSETIQRGPLLVRITMLVVHAAERDLGVQAATSLAALAVVAGVVAVVLILRLAAALTDDRGGRFFTAALLGTAGSMQLFFGHVEYYAVLAAAVLAYLLLASAAAQDRAPVWPTWLAYGTLLPLHLSTLALAPAQVVLAMLEWKRGRRVAALIAPLGAAVLAWELIQLTGEPARALASSSMTGLQRYVAPFADVSSTRHAFGFLSPSHLLALLNDMLLVAPLALAALPAILIGAWTARQATPTARARRDPLQLYFTIAVCGCLALDVLFNREVGPYRDWDNLAPFGYVYLAWTAARLVRPHPGSLRAALALAAGVGAFHLVPWVALNASPRAALAHIERVLDAPSQWSPSARGYLYEEIAIYRRDRGDADGALHAYEAAVRANPADARYHVGLGVLYYQRRELERAAREFETALRHRPDFAAAHNNLAASLIALDRDLDGARQHLESALRQNPMNPDYLTTLGSLEMRLGNLAAARAALERALLGNPQSVEARRRLDEVARRQQVATPLGH